VPKLTAGCQLPASSGCRRRERLLQALSFRPEMERADVAIGVHPLGDHFPRGAVCPARRFRSAALNRCPADARVFVRGDRGVPMSMFGLSCVESCLNCHLRSRNFFCGLSQDSLEAFDKIKHAAVFPNTPWCWSRGKIPAEFLFSARAAPNLPPPHAMAEP